MCFLICASVRLLVLFYFSVEFSRMCVSCYLNEGGIAEYLVQIRLYHAMVVPGITPMYATEVEYTGFLTCYRHQLSLDWFLGRGQFSGKNKSRTELKNGPRVLSWFYCKLKTFYPPNTPYLYSPYTESGINSAPFYGRYGQNNICTSHKQTHFPTSITLLCPLKVSLLYQVYRTPGNPGLEMVQ